MKAAAASLGVLVSLVGCSSSTTTHPAQGTSSDGGLVDESGQGSDSGQGSYAGQGSYSGLDGYAGQGSYGGHGGNAGQGSYGGHGGNAGRVGQAGHGGTSGSGGAATGGRSGLDTLGPPAEISTVLLPKINPAWPIGEWEGDIYSPQVTIDCGSSGQRSYSQVYDVQVTAGAGLDFAAEVIMESGAAIGDWTGTLSDDKQSIQVPTVTNTFAGSGGTPVTRVNAPTLFKLVGVSSTELTARLYTGSTATSGSETCNFQVKDYTLTNTDHRLSTVMQGTSSVSLDQPVALKRWGAFPVSGLGLGMDEPSFRHPVTPVVDGGALPAGIVFDEQAWAVKVATNAIWFYVMIRFANQGSEPVCMYEPDISSVENSANLPVYKSLSTSVAAPSSVGWTLDTVCLRPGEAGWLITSVSVASGDSAAFANAAIAKIKPPTLRSAYPDSYAPTPYRAHYEAGQGLHVDVIDAPDSLSVVFLDEKGLPVGTDYTSDGIPERSSLQHLVFTFSFPEPEVLGTATTALVFTSSTPP